ncbi:unnamed protein product [Discula destructiva]
MSTRAPLSPLAKLVQCQHILGYQFKDISLLQRALSVRTVPWKILATAGDTYVQAALIDRWYERAERGELTSNDFATIRSNTLTNHSFCKVGYKKGLVHCTTPRATTDDQMATTVEAVLAAVYRDSLFEDGVRKPLDHNAFMAVVARLGINHPLIASASDLRWALEPITTTRRIPYFFTKGNHFALTKACLELGAASSLPRSYKAYASAPLPASPRVPPLARATRVVDAGAADGPALGVQLQTASVQVKKESITSRVLNWFRGSGTREPDPSVPIEAGPEERFPKRPQRPDAKLNKEARAPEIQVSEPDSPADRSLLAVGDAGPTAGNIAMSPAADGKMSGRKSRRPGNWAAEALPDQKSQEGIEPSRSEVPISPGTAVETRRSLIDRRNEFKRLLRLRPKLHAVKRTHLRAQVKETTKRLRMLDLDARKAARRAS